MPVFEYTARNVKGEVVQNKGEFATRDDVLAHLRKNRMVVVQVREAPRAFKIKFGAGIKTRDVVIFTRQFATMINAGLPLVQALDILAQQTENKILADTTRQVVRSEEHTSELQSRSDLVCRLLLEKKKNTATCTTTGSPGRECSPHTA